MPDTILFTGGARSGKSRLARAWAEARPAPRRFIATADETADDAEMAERIARHRAERACQWSGTSDARLDVAGALYDAADEGQQTALIDCVTLWLSNLGFHHDWAEAPILAAVDALAKLMLRSPLHLALVTNEVGSGIVPETPLARRFRDLQGFANQRLATAAQRVALVSCGLPLWLK